MCIMYVTRRMNYQSMENERLLNQILAPTFNLCPTKNLFMHSNNNFLLSMLLLFLTAFISQTKTLTVTGKYLYWWIMESIMVR